MAGNWNEIVFKSSNPNHSVISGWERGAEISIAAGAPSAMNHSEHQPAVCAEQKRKEKH